MTDSTIQTPFNFPSHAIKDDGKKKVVFCIPTITKPYKVTLDSLEDSISLITKAGWEEGTVYQIGCPYISAARAMMLRKALTAGATSVIFLDHDLSWDPEDLLLILEAEGDVVAGTYRFKGEPEEYMGSIIPGIDGRPIVREDGCIKASFVPGGFLKITRSGVNKFMAAYPELLYGERCNPMIDLFNHGAHDWTWYGEDYSFARRWTAKCGDIWTNPFLNIAHHSPDKAYPGNFARYLRGQGGGSESANPNPPQELKGAWEQQQKAA